MSEIYTVVFEVETEFMADSDTQAKQLAKQIKSALDSAINKTGLIGDVQIKYIY